MNGKVKVQIQSGKYLLTIQTDADCLQRVKTSGQYCLDVIGAGKESIIHQAWVGPGQYEFKFWYWPQGERGWIPSKLLGGGTADGDHWLYAGPVCFGKDDCNNTVIVTFTERTCSDEKKIGPNRAVFNPSAGFITI